MRGARAKAIRKACRLQNLPTKYIVGNTFARQEQADGKVKKFFGDLKAALQQPKTYLVTGQISSPAAQHYRAAKRAWVRRSR